LSDLSDSERVFLEDYDCPEIDIEAFTVGPPLDECRVAVVTTAGLRRRSDRSFAVDASDYRLLPSGERQDFVMDHVSSGHDRTGFALDLNTVLPLDRLADLAESKVIGGVADLHYSFMGAGDVLRMRPAARQIATAMKHDGVDTVLLSPV
jgi:D-proline reductase (dithiol) PrdB